MGAISKVYELQFFSVAQILAFNLWNGTWPFQLVAFLRLDVAGATSCLGMSLGEKYNSSLLQE